MQIGINNNKIEISKLVFANLISSKPIMQIMYFNHFNKIIFFTCISIASSVSAQTAREQCAQNVDYLRQDLLSMLAKTPGMPPIAQVYVAAKERFDDIKTMYDRGDYQGCVNESRRVLQITKPYGNR